MSRRPARAPRNVRPPALSMIEVFQLRPAAHDYPDKPHAELYTGGFSPAISYETQGSDRLKRWLPEDAVEVEAWGDYPYRRVWRSAATRSHVTYCEGDVSLLVARDDECLAAIDKSADAFYRDH